MWGTDIRSSGRVEPGELVFTSLTKEALHIVRTLTRDLTREPVRLRPGTARTMRRMEKITGRSDDMLIIRGVNDFPTQIEEQILNEPKLAPHTLLEVSKEGPLDRLDVLVELKPEFANADRDESVAVANSLAHNALIGVTAGVKIVPVSSIERSVGKAKRVLDKRRKS